MSIQLQEIKNIFIKNRLTEDVDFVRKEWLKGDTVAYIDTNVIVNTATLKLKFNCYNKSNIRGCICGSRNTSSLASDTTAIHTQNQQYRLDIIARSDYQWAPMNTFDSFDIDLSTNTVTISGTTITSTKQHTNSRNTFRVFGCVLASVGYSGGLNDFIIDDGSHVFNLTPCQLLKSIPATLDANNIARQAGECGMYDSISGKFYGNVANSGTFTVEGEVEPETHTGLQQIYQKQVN